MRGAKAVTILSRRGGHTRGASKLVCQVLVRVSEPGRVAIDRVSEATNRSRAQVIRDMIEQWEAEGRFDQLPPDGRSARRLMGLDVSFRADGLIRLTSPDWPGFQYLLDRQDELHQAITVFRPLYARTGMAR